ncbi:hypothetical protein [Lysobacter solisilvae (ex Woo and Kim 2020)]|uniref:Uncharacterized protein n=1 Tax=Agrilutibacter terrestris TaxID=2865112 RepID=A0A7H0G0V4_9GAMM|nr:hypothetical protein [Lysobacter terrestris]QNP41920.1 hypothetical protein H8B22_06930 [Lysobacter terrestris]
MSSDATSRPDAAPPLHVLGALALELRGDAPVAQAALAQADAGELAAHIARDLATFAPDAAKLQLVTVGAHYDPVELLRPGWALHRELDQLAARAPGDAAGRIIAFGAHAEQLPGALAPSPDHYGGPLRLVPFVLGGDADVVAGVGDRFERELIEKGMAGAATALAAQEAFGVEIEHARYLTAHDLAAMTALQYEHAGLAPLWPLLETALLDPDGEAWLDAPPEPLVHYADGEARIALFEPRAWKQRYADEAPCDTPECREKLERRHQHFLARQRQIAAVLGAHGVPVHFVHCAEASADL